MTLDEIISTALGACGGIAILAIIFKLIKLTPLEIDIWEWIGSSLMKSTNAKIDCLAKDVQDLRRDFDAHVDEDEKGVKTSDRRNIINFSSEISRGVKHTEEQYNLIIEDIDSYELYCLKHPEYENTKAVASILNIKQEYNECLKNNSFLR